MAEPKSNPAPAPKARLAPASESSDPAVHQVLAELATARSNGNEDEARAVAKRLADLGYE